MSRFLLDLIFLVYFCVVAAVVSKLAYVIHRKVSRSRAITATIVVWASAACLVVGFGFPLLGPRVVHSYYRHYTTAAERESKRELYHRLSEAESSRGSDWFTLREERMAIFYWFHARGWGIDEGHEAGSWQLPWLELFEYWKNENARVDSRVGGSN